MEMEDVSRREKPLDVMVGIRMNPGTLQFSMIKSGKLSILKESKLIILFYEYGKSSMSSANKYASVNSGSERMQTI